MKVLVDTSVWSLALRRSKDVEDKHIEELKDFAIETEDYELAGEYFNTARKSGIQGSNTDFLLCASKQLYGKIGSYF